LQNAHDILRGKLEALRGCVGLTDKHHAILDELETLTRPFMVPVQGEEWVKFGLPPMQARLACLLHTRLGKLVTHENLYDAMWFDDPDGGKCPNTLSVQLMHMRNALEGHYRVENIWGRGFIMHRVEQPEQIVKAA
jgi:DNA-binding response OmpR family regulator